MLCQSEGVLPGSDFYFFTPSATAKKQLFYFTSVGHFFCDFGYRVEREDYGNYLLLLVKKGKLSVTTGGETYPVREGDMAFINCHLPHAYQAIGFTEFLWIHFDGGNTPLFHEEMTHNLTAHPVFHLEQCELMEQRLRAILADCRYDKSGSEYENSLRIYQVLIELSKYMAGSRGGEGEVEDPCIAQAIRLIGARFSENLSVKMIAEQVGLSESYFSHKFRKSTNSSPKEYLIRRRLNEAKHLLKTTSLTVKEIALRSGFNSESHFINTFTAQNGISPKRFREFPI